MQHHPSYVIENPQATRPRLTILHTERRERLVAMSNGYLCTNTMRSPQMRRLRHTVQQWRFDVTAYSEVLTVKIEAVTHAFINAWASPAAGYTSGVGTQDEKTTPTNHPSPPPAYPCRHHHHAHLPLHGLHNRIDCLPTNLSTTHTHTQVVQRQMPPTTPSLAHTAPSTYCSDPNTSASPSLAHASSFLAAPPSSHGYRELPTFNYCPHAPPSCSLAAKQTSAQITSNSARHSQIPRTAAVKPGNAYQSATESCQPFQSSHRGQPGPKPATLASRRTRPAPSRPWVTAGSTHTPTWQRWRRAWGCPCLHELIAEDRRDLKPHRPHT